MWEAGLGYSITPDLDINAGYRYLNTKLADKGDMPGLKDDANISYKGFIAGLSYRFGSGHKAAPVEEAPAPVYEAPAPAPVEAPHVYNDYYLDSIHFGFKLTGNTDSKGSDAYNTDLSKRRVDNVAQYAVNNGVPASQMILDYKSFHDPVSSNDTDQGRADNRRVDIWEHK